MIYGKIMPSNCSVILLVVVVFAVSDGLCLISKQLSEIDNLVQNLFIAENNVPGAGVTIVENFGEAIFAKGYGSADVKNNVAASSSTKFCIASITKVKELATHPHAIAIKVDFLFL